MTRMMKLRPLRSIRTISYDKYFMILTPIRYLYYYLTRGREITAYKFYFRFRLFFYSVEL